MQGDLILVTGAAGFIGSHVARHFAASGHRVVGCDRMGRDERWRNLVDVALHDLITPEALPDWLGRNSPGLVVHMGAISATTETDIDRIAADNVRASIQLWDWCTASGARLIYASSAATYGDGSAGFDDDGSPAALARLRPLNAYGWSKLLVDRRVAADVAAGRPTPPHWAGLRFFNVYGPGESHKGDMRSVVTKIIPTIRDGGTVRLFRSCHPGYADGGQMRDFVFVGDVVRVIAWLAGADTCGLFNLGSGVARSWLDLAHAVFAAMNQPPRIEYVDMPDAVRRQYQYFTQADMARLHQAGWNGAATSLEDGAAATVQAALGRPIAP